LFHETKDGVSEWRNPCVTIGENKVRIPNLFIYLCVLLFIIY